MDQDRVDAVRQRIVTKDRKRQRAEHELVKVELSTIRRQLYQLADRLQTVASRVQALDHEMNQEETTVLLRKLPER